MYLKDKVAVVTGGAHGIGRALCRRFAAEGARGVVVADLDIAAARDVAGEIGGLAVAVDVANEEQVRRLVDESVKRFGPIDLFCSNAGIALGGGPEAPNSDWQKIWDINLMAHVYAARAVLPAMVERGEGYLLQTSSAAGLLTSIGSAPYAVTKHAAVGFAEWLRIAYGRQGVQVACLCPQSVQTGMTSSGGGSAALDGILSPEQVAGDVVAALRDGRFLVLPHPEVLRYFRNKAEDYECWIGGMQKLYGRHAAGG